MNDLPADKVEIIHNAADKALYHVKQNGKNAYHFFSDQTPADMEQASFDDKRDSPAFAPCGDGFDLYLNPTSLLRDT